jgi:hypothetical protein
MYTSVLNNAILCLGIDCSEAEIFLLTPDPLKTVIMEHFSLKVPYSSRELMDTPITIDDVIIEESITGAIDPSWNNGAIKYDKP